MDHIIGATGHSLISSDIVKAENCYVFDSEGRKFLDMESGVWCTSIGHCHPRITKVINQQIEKISHTGFNYCHPAIENTAVMVLQIANLPGGKCEFLCSGSEAVEFCIRVSKAITPKPYYLTFSDSYFGAYGDATQQQLSDWFRYDWLNCSCNGGKGCLAKCPEFQKIPFDKINTFVFEPGSSSGLVRFPSSRLVNAIAEKIRNNEGLIIVNEVTTGIGRTGKWFGFQHYDIEPDMIAIGKGVGNGFPVSIAVVSHKVARSLENSNFHYSQSHQNDPLGAVIAGEVINVIKEENLIHRSERLGHFLKSSLEGIASSNKLIKEVRGRGLMMVVEFSRNAALVQKELLNRGFLVVKRPENEVIRFDPALTIDEKDLKKFVENFRQVVGG